MNFIFRVFLNILSLISILIINIIIFYKKKNKKKILFVYLPHLKKKKNYYSKIFNKIENNFIIYSTLNLSISSNFYTIKPSYLKFIMGVDFFLVIMSLINLHLDLKEFIYTMIFMTHHL